MQQNSNLYEILNFLWQTLNLGFWEKTQEVQDILDNVIKILEPHPSILADY